MSDLTGEPFPEIKNEFVLRPAGMMHSTYEQPLPKSLSPFAAARYDENGQPVKGGWRTYREMAPAGLWTTPLDLAHLAIEVQKAYVGRSDKVLSRQIVHEMLTRQKDDWGLGVSLLLGHRLRFTHAGQNARYRCDLEAYADIGSGLAVMTNSDGGEFLIQELLRAVAKEYAWPDLPPVEHAVAKIDPCHTALIHRDLRKP